MAKVTASITTRKRWWFDSFIIVVAIAAKCRLLNADRLESACKFAGEHGMKYEVK